MKRIIVCIILAFIMLGSIAVISFAEEQITAETFANGVLDRVFEWWEVNRAEILAACSGLGAALSGIIVWYKSKKPFISLMSSAKTTDEREVALIKGYNDMVEVVDKQSKIIESLSNKVDELQAQITNTENIEAHIAKVLSTVYTNSIALPQGVKDMINVECAQCMTIANKDLGVEVKSYDETDEGNVD